MPNMAGPFLKYGWPTHRNPAAQSTPRATERSDGLPGGWPSVQKGNVGDPGRPLSGQIRLLRNRYWQITPSCQSRSPSIAVSVPQLSIPGRPGRCARGPFAVVPNQTGPNQSTKPASASRPCLLLRVPDYDIAYAGLIWKGYDSAACQIISHRPSSRLMRLHHGTIAESIGRC